MLANLHADDKKCADGRQTPDDTKDHTEHCSGELINHIKQIIHEITSKNIL